MALANFDLQGDAVSVMPSIVFFLSGAASIGEENVLRVEIPLLVPF